jgi:hypothetical protein
MSTASKGIVLGVSACALCIADCVAAALTFYLWQRRNECLVRVRSPGLLLLQRILVILFFNSVVIQEIMRQQKLQGFPCWTTLWCSVIVSAVALSAINRCFLPLSSSVHSNANDNTNDYLCVKSFSHTRDKKRNLKVVRLSIFKVWICRTLTLVQCTSDKKNSYFLHALALATQVPPMYAVPLQLRAIGVIIKSNAQYRRKYAALLNQTAKTVTLSSIAVITVIVASYLQLSRSKQVLETDMCYMLQPWMVVVSAVVVCLPPSIWLLYMVQQSKERLYQKQEILTCYLSIYITCGPLLLILALRQYGIVHFTTTVNLLGNILPLIVFYQACAEVSMLRTSYVCESNSSCSVNTSVLRCTRTRIAAVDYKDDNNNDDMESAIIDNGKKQWSSCKAMLDSVTMRNAFSVHILACCCSEYWLFLIDAREYLKLGVANTDKLTQVHRNYITCAINFGEYTVSSCLHLRIKVSAHHDITCVHQSLISVSFLFFADNQQYVAFTHIVETYIKRSADYEIAIDIAIRNQVCVLYFTFIAINCF